MRSKGCSASLPASPPPTEHRFWAKGARQRPAQSLHHARRAQDSKRRALCRCLKGNAPALLPLLLTFSAFFSTQEMLKSRPKWRRAESVPSKASGGRDPLTRQTRPGRPGTVGTGGHRGKGRLQQCHVTGQKASPRKNSRNRSALGVTGANHGANQQFPQIVSEIQQRYPGLLLPQPPSCLPVEGQHGLCCHHRTTSLCL